MRRVFTFLVALAMLGLTTSALADVPTEMSVQGRLTDGGGAPVPAGLKNFTFKIWDAPAGGTEIWPAGVGELQTLATDANGLWNAGVGQIIPLTEAVFLSPVRWLEVTVDDGVNPPETLPRIELRTNPYTYRAATSQQADSLAGNSFGDIADMFVDEPGDTMSGQLLIDYPTAASGDPSLRVNNVNDANSPSLFGAYTFGVTGDASSDGPETKFALVGAAKGADGGAVGVIGQAEGTGNINIGVWGYTSGGASGDNYSGYFQGGDVVVSNPATPGTAGVVLPSDAIDNSEILDEPGIAFSSIVSGPGLLPSATAQDFLTVSITTPAAGYIVVHGSATISMAGTNAFNFVWMQIDQTAGGSFSSRFAWIGAGSYASASNSYQSTDQTKVYFLGAGTHTFRLEGNAWTGNDGAAISTVYQCDLMATFVPTSYGTVSSLVAERGNFQEASMVRITDPQRDVDAVVYKVDLRELELKAAREQAEAEKARRELVEARLATSALMDDSPTQEKKR